LEAGYQQLQIGKPTLVITPQLRSPDLPKDHAYTLQPGHPTPGLLNLLRHPIASVLGAGILTCFPSTTALALILGADSPCADERGAGNLGLSASGPFTRFIATHVSIRTSDTSSNPHESPSTAYGTLSYHLRAPLKTLSWHRLHHRGGACRASRAHITHSGATRALRTTHNVFNGARKSLASADSLSPVTSSAQDDSTSELLRFL
jgi:hypothetical protein